MFCFACGAQVADRAKFCARCGKPVAGEELPQMPQVPEFGQDPAMRLLLPVGRSPLAILAGYLGLVAVLCVPAPFALAVGIMAWREIKRDPSKHGMGRAIFGIVMGGIFSALALVWIVAALLHK